MSGFSLQGSNSRTRDIELITLNFQSNDRDETEETSHSEYTPTSQISSRSPQNSNTIVGSSKQNFVSKIWGMIVDWYTSVSKTEVEAKL
ncbi:MAG: hypothetical protein HAW66_09540, partial [Shewanella sp.]|nr:hypothetical protein [Shewanella sp.]